MLSIGMHSEVQAQAIVSSSHDHPCHDMQFTPIILFIIIFLLRNMIILYDPGKKGEKEKFCLFPLPVKIVIQSSFHKSS